MYSGSMKTCLPLLSLLFVVCRAYGQDSSAPAKQVLASKDGIAKTIRVLKTGNSFDRKMAIGAIDDATLKKRKFTYKEQVALIDTLYQLAKAQDNHLGREIPVSSDAVEGLAHFDTLEAIEAFEKLARSKSPYTQRVAIHGMLELALHRSDAAAFLLEDAQRLTKSKDPELVKQAKSFIEMVKNR